MRFHPMETEEIEVQSEEYWPLELCLLDTKSEAKIILSACISDDVMKWNYL